MHSLSKLHAHYIHLHIQNYHDDLAFAEYIVSTGHLTPHASKPKAGDEQFANSSTFCAFLKFEDFMARDCKIERKINSPKVTQDWITCAAGFHSRGCDVYVNTTILKTHMDLLIKESLCRPEQKKDFLSAIVPSGTSTEASEEYTEYIQPSSSSSSSSSLSPSPSQSSTSVSVSTDVGSFGTGGDVNAQPEVEVI